MLLRRLAGFYMPSGDLSSFEARYYFFLSRLRGPYFGYFPFSFSLLLARKCIFEGIFSRMPNFFIFLNSFTVIGFSFSLSFAGLAEGYHLG